MENKKTNNNGNKKTNFKKGNGRRRPNFKKDVDEEEVKTDKYGKQFNDPAWYAKNAQLLKDAASLAFSNRSGDYLDLGITYNSQASGANPGIMALNWVPSLGVLANPAGGVNPDPTDAINLAAKNIYSFVRHANSGSANYDAPDLMMCIQAADSVYSVLAMLYRIYGVYRVWDQKNRYVPTALLDACGLANGDLGMSLADFRCEINNLVAKASVIWVPSNISAITRHFWMNSNVYKDSDNAKSQMYVYRQVNAWKFEPKTSETGSSLSVVDLSNKTGSQLIAIAHDMLNPIIEDEDLGIMFGDMLKAYGKEKLYTVQPINEEYTVLPVFNKEVLMQIHNTIAFNFPLNPVEQNEYGIIYENIQTLSIPVAEKSKAMELTNIPPKYIFDYQDMIPEPENIMVSSRLTQCLLGVSAHSGNANIVVNLSAASRCGSERILNYTVFWYDATNALRKSNMVTYNYVSQNTSEIYVALVDRFNWAPYIYEMVDTAPSSYVFPNNDGQIKQIYGDMDNYTIVDRDVLNKMHRTAVMSEYDVPLSL